MAAEQTNQLPYYRSKEDKLVMRFYEPLVLLKVLDTTQGDRIPRETFTSHDPQTQHAASERRLILDYLATVCDFDKGGNTVTALALENLPEGPTYWVSSPGGLTTRVLPFLHQTLSSLSLVASMTPDGEDMANAERTLFEEFTLFCTLRLRKTWRILQRVVEEEIEHTTSQDRLRWLERCQRPVDTNESLFGFCEWAHEAKRSPFGLRLSRGRPEYQSSFSVRHFLGRMGSVLRAARGLVRLALNHIELFEHFKLQPVPCGGPIPGPSIDVFLTLDGIASRMAGNNKALSENLKDALGRLDLRVGIMQSIKSQYEDEKFKPRVHAEVALLDALYRADIDFYADDRYIACSKAACFCCYHYICSHPGQFVRPAGHNNLWLNWRFSNLEDAARPNAEAVSPATDATTAATGSSLGQTEQRRIMNDMIASIRTVAIRKVLRSSGMSTGRHPDSSTGITATASVAAAPQQEEVGLRTLTEHTEQGYIESDSESEMDEVDGGVSLGRIALTA